MRTSPWCSTRSDAIVRWSWLAVATWMIVVLLNSSVPAAPLPAGGLLAALLSKAGHVLEYLILGFLACRALDASRDAVRLGPAARAVLVMIGGSVFASLDELRQFFVPGRGANPLDVVIDGVALGALSITRVRLAPGQMRGPG